MPEKYEKMKDENLTVPPSEKKNVSQADICLELLQSAKKNFYMDLFSIAGELCNLLINNFPFSEEADEAKLLLHDIETKKGISAAASLEKKSRDFIEKIGTVTTDRNALECLYCSKDLSRRAGECKYCLIKWSRKKISKRVSFAVFNPPRAKKTAIPIAIAVVVLPIIGIAKGGIIGIGLPEIAALLITGGLFWGSSKIRN